MYPSLHLAGRALPSYLVVLLLALGAALAAALLFAPRLGVKRGRMAVLALVAIGFGLAGAKLQSVLLETGLTAWLAQPSFGTGFAEQGGMFFGGIALVTTSLMLRVPVLDTLDLAAVGAALGLSIGRLGCLLAGCCFGRPTLFPIALVYTNFRAPARPVGVPLHATPIYASAACAAIF
jgi:phosphatidylglycerol:prolipoprotein diacylglycerol transferase